MIFRYCLCSCVQYVLDSKMTGITFANAGLWKVSAVAEVKRNNDTEDTCDDELNVASLKRQLATLTSSLYTVTEQKSRMEATYVSEKRKLKVKWNMTVTWFNKLIFYLLVVGHFYNLMYYFTVFLRSNCSSVVKAMGGWVWWLEGHLAKTSVMLYRTSQITAAERWAWYVSAVELDSAQWYTSFSLFAAFITGT